MTKRFFFVLVFLLFSTSLFAQTGWFTLTDFEKLGDHYTDFYFLSPDTGFVGDFESLPLSYNSEFTEDGGKSWRDILSPRRLISPTTSADKLIFFSVNFGDSNISRTIDSGKTWSSYLVDTFFRIENYDFVSPSIGFVSGHTLPLYQFFLFKTLDSGRTWQKIFSAEGSILVKFRDTVNGMISVHTRGGSGQYGWDTTWYTADAGTHWRYCESRYSPYSIHYFETYKKWGITYYNGIQFSHDDGLTWDLRKIDPNDSIFNESHNASKYTFIQDSIGYVILDNCKIYRTTDGGETWYLQKTPVGFQRKKTTRSNIIAVTDKIVYAMNDSVIIKTIDGGGPAASVILTKEKDYTLIPNPSTDHITITLEASLVAETLEVYNSLGAKVLVSEIPANSISYRLDISHLASGIYLAKAGSRIMRFVKE
jgi:photosystem II stability/assembly factor-like uncharacterized protein